MSLILIEGDDKYLNIDGKNYKVLKEFGVMHIGWEMDNRGFVVEGEGKNEVVLTNHNRPYFADRKELREMVERYEMVIKGTVEAIGLL
jgi:hypothetical protein